MAVCVSSEQDTVASALTVFKGSLKLVSNWFVFNVHVCRNDCCIGEVFVSSIYNVPCMHVRML